jgi:hypothetical protein
MCDNIVLFTLLERSIRPGTMYQWLQEGDTSSSLYFIYSSVINYQLVAV